MYVTACLCAPTYLLSPSSSICRLLSVPWSPFLLWPHRNHIPAEDTEAEEVTIKWLLRSKANAKHMRSTCLYTKSWVHRQQSTFCWCDEKTGSNPVVFCVEWRASVGVTVVEREPISRRVASIQLFRNIQSLFFFACHHKRLLEMPQNVEWGT